MFGKLFKRKPAAPVPAYARVNARAMPMHRGDWLEDPLQAALEADGFATVTGGGTGLSESHEVEYCGIDIDLHDVDRGALQVIGCLNKLGAPKGSTLQYEKDGRAMSIPFGTAEGLGLYLNGTDLPEDVYKTSDINAVIDSLSSRLRAAGAGAIRSHWEGPRETALYMYGPSFSAMRQAIAPVLESTPLCQRARVVQIA